jgi:hypothetical protein
MKTNCVIRLPISRHRIPPGWLSFFMYRVADHDTSAWYREPRSVAGPQSGRHGRTSGARMPEPWKARA